MATQSAAQDCQLCEIKGAKYTCPRCNIFYCSLECYKSANHAECSETFYKDCVLENLQSANAEASDVQKMQEIFKRVHEIGDHASGEESDDNLDSDDEKPTDLADRLAGIDLNDTDRVWERLTSDERQQFESFVRSDDLTKLIPQWEPWWAFHCDKNIVDVEEIERHKKTCPPLLEAAPNYDDLSKKPPSDSVKFNLTNILAAYVFTVRYFMGDHHAFVQEAVSYIVHLSLCLKKNVTFESFNGALDSIQQECISNDWILADEENIQFMKSDIAMVLKGPYHSEQKFYVMAALSDLYALIRRGLAKKKNDATAATTSENLPKLFHEAQFPPAQTVARAQLKPIKKKLEFYIAYSKDILQFDL